jgi:hypothetical protein
MKSMLAAGYDKFEVEEAAKRLLKYISDAQIPQGQAPKPAEAKEKKSKKEELLAQSTTPSPTQQTPSAPESPAPLKTPSPKPLPEIKAPKKKIGKKILIILAILLLAAMQGWFIYFLIKKFL